MRYIEAYKKTADKLDGLMRKFLNTSRKIGKDCLNFGVAKIGLRPRHFLTSQNRLRLRFLILPAALLCGGPVLAAFFSSTSQQAPGSEKFFPYAQKTAFSDAVQDEMRAVSFTATREKTGRRDRDDRGNHSSQREVSQSLGLVSFSSTAVVRAENGMLIPAPPPAKPALPLRRTLRIESGDTLAGLLQKNGVSGSDTYKIIEIMTPHFDPRNVRPGQAIEVTFSEKDKNSATGISSGSVEDRGRDFQSLEIHISPMKYVFVSKEGDGTFSAAVKAVPVTRQVLAGKADIKVSLYGSAAKAGIPVPVISEIIRLYSWDLDFQRDIRRGDRLEVLYDRFVTETGETATSGDVLFARLNVRREVLSIYRYELADGTVDYFEENGQSIRKALMTTPVDGARISSGYGMRKHPILGYNKMHKGVDFAAPTGTPVYAAGDGVIERANRFSSYGNYVRIRHNSTLKTAYAHLHKFAKGIRSGVRVKQGQVIAYVGTTGRSTGPHLHYEVLVNGQQVNPKSVDLPQGEALRGEDLKRFKAHVARIDRKYEALAEENARLAQAESGGGRNGNDNVSN